MLDVTCVDSVIVTITSVNAHMTLGQPLGAQKHTKDIKYVELAETYQCELIAVGPQVFMALQHAI